MVDVQALTTHGLKRARAKHLQVRYDWDSLTFGKGQWDTGPSSDKIFFDAIDVLEALADTGAASRSDRFEILVRALAEERSLFAESTYLTIFCHDPDGFLDRASQAADTRLNSPSVSAAVLSYYKKLKI